jgi:membrane protease YdiL (CAAX protease family)
MTDQPPLWQRALPFLALMPAAGAPLIGNAGSLTSLAIVLLALVLVKVTRGPTFALVNHSWWRDILIGIAAGAFLAVAFDHVIDPLIKDWIGPIKLDDFSNVRGNLPNFLILLALGLVYGGIAEETVFRGFVIGWGSSLFGNRAAWPLAILSSIVFGVAHAYQGIGGMVSTGLTGLAFAAIYVLNGRRLLMPMLVHMTLDTIGIVELYLGVSS